MSDNNLHVHVTLEDGVVARVAPEALNDPEFVTAMNQLIHAAKRQSCAERRKREAKERYQDWLRADSGLPFMEWVRRRTQRP